MTDFRKHDRLRVVDDGRRSLTRGPFPYKRGEIVTAASPTGKKGLILLDGDANPFGWTSDRFELVERCVDTDRNGKPLYIGDTVRRVAGGGQTVEYEGTVTAERGDFSGVPIRRKGSGVMTPPAEFVELIHHHWERVVKFQVDDRVRVLDTADRPAELPVGEILTVEATAEKGRYVINNGESWKAERFELVEHSTGCSDREGRPLYAGDVVEWGTPDRRQGKVMRTQWRRDRGVQINPAGTDPATSTWVPSERLTLVRHHWEPEPERVVVGVDPAASGEPFAVVGWVGDDGIRLYPAGVRPEGHWGHMHWNGELINVQEVLDEIARVKPLSSVPRWPGPWQYRRDVDLPDGSVVVLTKAFGTPELHRIQGTWVDAKSGQRWTDLQLSRHTFEIIRKKES